jgi:hypothetical protein
MHFGYVNLVNNFNPSIKQRKCLITYYKTYGVIGLKKHVDVGLVIIIAKAIEEEVNSLIRVFVFKKTNKLKAQFVRHSNL